MLGYCQSSASATAAEMPQVEARMAAYFLFVMQLLWLHMSRLSLTLKSLAESLAFIIDIYAWALPETVSNRLRAAYL